MMRDDAHAHCAGSYSFSAHYSGVHTNRMHAPVEPRPQTSTSAFRGCILSFFGLCYMRLIQSYIHIPLNRVISRSNCKHMVAAVNLYCGMQNDMVTLSVIPAHSAVLQLIMRAEYYQHHLSHSNFVVWALKAAAATQQHNSWPIIISQSLSTCLFGAAVF